MRVHHLNCATMRPLGGRLIDGADGVLRSAEMVCHCLLIETEQGLVLVDTGFGTSDVQDPRSSLPWAFRRLMRPVLDPEETALRQVRRLGHDPADVRHIVLTHLDIDHAGGLPDFPHAQVHVFGPELRAATGPSAPWRYRPGHWAHEPDWIGYQDLSGERWFGFDAVRALRDLPESILLVPLPGHTTGHAGVAVDTGAGWLLHAGDAYFFNGEMAPSPHCTPALRAFQRHVDTARALREHNQRRLRELGLDHPGEIDIICAHDPVELRSHKSARADGNTA
ncbi:MBL fold metallo-hydrolase [Saccharopolyspora gloriosae]|uniref:MBL fold metallo-hydrolase n=1 Tax=Saccharopolyspora gloriosae TaxID=455344 RepID=UPI001FB65A33|nr:MBL fold metallo-hydrolase [Saccharopolyspora gloriosae]